MANRVRIEREARGWSPEKLAAEAGCSKETIRNVETERFNPRFATVANIARALRMSVDDLFPDQRGNAA